MNREQSFNIITGEIKKEYPLNSTSRRFSSQSEIKRAKENGEYVQPMPQIRRLGTSSDSRAFNYGYETKHGANFKTIGSDPRHHVDSSKSEKTSLINASKLTFNIMNHT